MKPPHIYLWVYGFPKALELNQIRNNKRIYVLIYTVDIIVIITITAG